MQYLTKTQLIRRWSPSLVERYFPYPSTTRDNPKHPRGAPMQLYDIYEIMQIEHMESFKKEWKEILVRRYKRQINKQLNS
jgi:hypothetical protein